MDTWAQSYLYIQSYLREGCDLPVNQAEICTQHREVPMGYMYAQTITMQGSQHLNFILAQRKNWPTCEWTNDPYLNREKGLLSEINTTADPLRQGQNH